MAEASPAMQQYLQHLDDETSRVYAVAAEARKRGFDPEPKVDIPIARNMAERVEGLISAAAPELSGTGMIARILDLEKKYGGGAWQVALLIAEEVAKETFCKFQDKRTAMEVGIRAGMAYSTAGIVAAPLEGFIELKLKPRRDGKGDYFSVLYAGPIRGAGGTAASVSVIIADYVRRVMGYAAFDPSEEEVKRYVAEIQDYHERVSNLQYFPSGEELTFMAQHIPVEVSGDPTEKFDVSNHKGLPRVETDKIRGGMCLVMAEGLSQKAQKLWDRLQVWGKEFGLEWGFLEEFLVLQKRIKAKSEKKEEQKQKIMPNYTYIKDLVAGRPVLTYPMRQGGFRLRYGRTRTSGFSACAIHPATQGILDKYIATGTQLKVERPGKAAAVTVCDAIDGPIVLLHDGSLVRLDTVGDASRYHSQIEEIVYLGDILFNYGDFAANGHLLVPPGYCEEWYAAEIKKALTERYPQETHAEALSALLCSLESFNPTETLPLAGAVRSSDLAATPASAMASSIASRMLKEPSMTRLSIEQCLGLSRLLSVPLHPRFTWYWNAISREQFSLFLEWMKKASLQQDQQDQLAKLSDQEAGSVPGTDAGGAALKKAGIGKIVIPLDLPAKRTLELLGVPHLCAMNEFVVIEHEEATALVAQLIGSHHSLPDALSALQQLLEPHPDKQPLEILQLHSPILLRDKLGTFIGARMGRPEKAKMRRLTGSPQVLFPVGDEGGRLRSFQAAMAGGKVTSNFPLYKCHACDKESLFRVCEGCRAATVQLFFCKVCGPKQTRACEAHGPCRSSERRSFPITSYFQDVVKRLALSNYPDLIKGIRGTSNKDHIPEHLAKGILRATHDVYVNKDGTTRYDMSELPITHFKPMEIGTSVARLREMGYIVDIDSKPLENDQQVLELKPQDLILPAESDTTVEGADHVLFRIGRFIDDLLTSFYGVPAFYHFSTKKDIVGHLVIGLAPHISAGMIGRVIGFSRTQGMYCHPLYHAAMRRDCDGDEACVILLLDALLNFSRQYLPDKRGGRTMDSPLVLTTILTPSEVDDQAHTIDVVWDYPLAFYEACLQYKQAKECPIEQIKKRLGTPLQYEQMGYTIPVSNINLGVLCSAYKTLPSMEEKLLGQMVLAERIRAVDVADVAQMVIEKHFLKDTKGNLRKFSTQQFRCVSCNDKFRRPPLSGKCTSCKSKLLFTVSQGNITKYLEPSLSLARKYNLPPYLQQVLNLTKRRIEGMFGKEKEKQVGLGAWFG
ncbi:DNA polymerase II large subunit [Candidatus Woesearchaeota archaeon]|nr:DNA polymerase II large subunit [Candidatus Woesearchaeota archaeon]